jgi:hypothetical protein
MTPIATKGILMIKFKLEQQHRPFWGWVERHIKGFIIVDVFGLAILAFAYFHFNDIVNFLNHHPL